MVYTHLSILKNTSLKKQSTTTNEERISHVPSSTPGHTMSEEEKRQGEQDKVKKSRMYKDMKEKEGLGMKQWADGREGGDILLNSNNPTLIKAWELECNQHACRKLE